LSGDLSVLVQVGLVAKEDDEISLAREYVFERKESGRVRKGRKEFTCA
jgi:hypothetical protein